MHPTNSWQRGFWSLMATQFQNAFSDNALKYLVIMLVLARPMPEAERNSYVAVVGALFTTPFILFSMFGGWLADRFSKQRIMSAVKLAEIGIMLFAAVALSIHSLPLELGSIFLMGCHSAIFGPSKYGILPEILPLDRLSWGNGILELLTFLGIIMGTVAGMFLAVKFAPHHGVCGLMLTGLAAIGWGLSKGIPSVPAAAPGCPMRVNPIGDLWKAMKLMRPDRDLWRANWGNTGFFFVAALIAMNLVPYAKDVLHLSEVQNGQLNAALAIGIGLGSVSAGYASRGKIVYRLIPIGAAVMALGTVPMGMQGVSTMVFSFALVTLGFGGGLFIVPIAAVLQHRPSAETKGAVQGASGVLSNIGILVASLALVVLRQNLHLSSGQVFWFCGATALATGTYVAFTRRTEIFARPTTLAPQEPEETSKDR